MAGGTERPPQALVLSQYVRVRVPSLRWEVEVCS